MIKKQSLYRFLILNIVFVSIISYGVHIYKSYYSYFQYYLTGLMLLFLIIFLKYESDFKKNLKMFKNQSYILLIFMLMILNTLIGFEVYQFNSIKNVFSVVFIVICAFIEFYIFPFICVKYKKIEKSIINCFLRLCTLFSIVSILIEIGHGSFLAYSWIVVRNASVFYDPNFAAMIFGSAFVLTLKYEGIDNKFKRFILLFLFGIAVFLTGSRGTLLAIVLAIFLYILIYKKINITKKILLTISFIVISIVLLKYLYSIDFFRVYQGSNNRGEIWTYTLKFIKNHPFFGAGYLSIRNFLNMSGYHYASTHNSYIDFTFAYGILCFILYLFLIVSILFKSIKNKDKNNDVYILASIFSIINANTILYSFGGVGICSMLYTLFLGLLNYKLTINNGGLNEKN